MSIPKSLSELSDAFNISIWKNSHQLPDIKEKHKKELLQLELGLFFTFSYREESQQMADIFICPKTDLFTLHQNLPFYFENYQIYSCPSKLIWERLYVFKHHQNIASSNLANHLLDEILDSSVLQNATDIHFEKDSKTHYKVRIRIDGKLLHQSYQNEVEETLINKIKLLAGMDISQKRKPQDGSFQYYDKNQTPYDLRVSSISAANGEKLVIRILPADQQDLSLEKIGYRKDIVKKIRAIIQEKSGLIILTGATGSGKSTSLFSILNELDLKALNVMTVEDPIEYKLNNITQVQVNEKAGITFANTLRAFLRQDPDVILVGEIRDAETAEIATRAAQTGHLVLSTLHCNFALDAITRLKNLGVSGDNLASSIKLIIHQKLLIPPSSQKLKTNLEKSFFIRKNAVRIPVIEYLEINKKLRNAISDNKGIIALEECLQNSIYESSEKYQDSIF